MKLRKMTFIPVLAMALSPLASCSGGAGGVLSGVATGTTPTAAPPLASFPAEKPSNLRISLTDAPSKDLKSVFVNIDHAELFVKKGGANGRLIVAQNLGMVDLMTLRNGVLLPMQDLTLGAGTEITGIRLVLKGDNNHSIKSDDSRCEMQTPSGQQSGIKIHLAQPFSLENGSRYSMIMDFDAEKSVVIKGNGECLLKPVLKLLSVIRTTIPVDPPADPPADPPTDPGTGGGGEEPPAEEPPVDDPPIVLDPVTDGEDGNVDDGGNPAPGTGDGGFEIPMDPTDEAPVITEEETFEPAP